jgi:hypothetical protein
VSASHSESELFKACTTITIENGRHTKFWLDRWLHGRNPIEIAPALFRLARRKHITVAQALDQGTWLRRLQRIETPVEVSQFIDLWLLLSNMQLTAQPDAIAWKITANGSFSTNSVYNFQFFGSYADHDWTRLWAAKAEGKCKMFCRLILQNRMWTADRIVKHGGEANPPRDGNAHARHMPLLQTGLARPLRLDGNGTPPVTTPQLQKANDLVDKHARGP